MGSVDQILDWLVGALAALVGILWRRQETRMNRVEDTVATNHRLAMASVQKHEDDDYTDHDNLSSTMSAEVARLHTKIDETRREIKADINTVISLLQSRGP